MGKSVPNTVPNTTDIALGTVAAIARAVAKMAGQDFLFCKKCSATVLRNQHVCSECGEEMDWDPINKEKVIMCPSCDKEYVHGEKFCIDCTSPVKLEKTYH
jgi:predicted amidophosphoribosyltransferase